MIFLSISMHLLCEFLLTPGTCFSERRQIQRKLDQPAPQESVPESKFDRPDESPPPYQQAEAAVQQIETQLADKESLQALKSRGIEANVSADSENSPDAPFAGLLEFLKQLFRQLNVSPSGKPYKMVDQLLRWSDNESRIDQWKSEAAVGQVELRSPTDVEDAYLESKFVDEAIYQHQSGLRDLQRERQLAVADNDSLSVVDIDEQIERREQRIVVLQQHELALAKEQQNRQQLLLDVWPSSSKNTFLPPQLVADDIYLRACEGVDLNLVKRSPEFQQFKAAIVGSGFFSHCTLSPELGRMRLVSAHVSTWSGEALTPIMQAAARLQ